MEPALFAQVQNKITEQVQGLLQDHNEKLSNAIDSALTEHVEQEQGSDKDPKQFKFGITFSVNLGLNGDEAEVVTNIGYSVKHKDKAEAKVDAHPQLDFEGNETEQQ